MQRAMRVLVGLEAREPGFPEGVLVGPAVEGRPGWASAGFFSPGGYGFSIAYGVSQRRLCDSAGQSVCKDNLVWRRRGDGGRGLFVGRRGVGYGDPAFACVTGIARDVALNVELSPAVGGYHV